MSTGTILLLVAVAILFIAGLIKVLLKEDNSELLENIEKMDSEENWFDTSKGKSSKQLQNELDLIEKSFDEGLLGKNQSLDMTGLSGRSIVALKDLSIRDTNGLSTLRVQSLIYMKGVGTKKIEDIQAWAKGAYDIDVI